MEGLDIWQVTFVTYNNFLNNFPHNYFLCWIRAFDPAGASRRAIIGARTGTEQAEQWSEDFKDI